MVFARPAAALAGARAVLAGRPEPGDASIAHQVIGLVHREFGELAAAIPHLRRALTLARRAGSADRVADVQASLGIALVHAGHTAAGLRTLREAAGTVGGVSAARVRFRLGGALRVLGRHDEALAELRAAIPVLREGQDTVWLGRALSLRALIQLARGQVVRADLDLRAAVRLFADAGQDHDHVTTVHNRGMVAFRAGDLPAALGLLDDADRRYRSLGTPMPEVVMDRCTVLLAAGLPHEALAEADAATGHLRHLRGHATRRAELLLVAAKAAAAAGNPTVALDRASAAARLFAAQGRPWWQAHARLMVVQARFASAGPTPRLLAEATGTAHRLARLDSPEATQAMLLAGRLALRLNRPTDGDRLLAQAAGLRSRGTAMTRAEGWLAQALRAAAAGQTRPTLAACRRGLDVLAEHRLTLGASELRARATAHGAELTELALRTCLRAGGARRLLQWSERGRSAACAVPSARPPDDAEFRAELAALRATISELDQARERGLPAAALQRSQHRLERQIRGRTLHAPGTRPAGQPGRLDVGALLDALGPERLLEIVEVDGTLHVLVCGGGRVRRLAAGCAATAVRDVELARWTLRRLAYAPGPAQHADLLERLTAAGSRLEETLLGPAARHLGEGPVVIIPPGRLHGVPWAVLPCLASRPHTVAPSAATWLRARTAAPPGRDHVVLVRGPHLASGGAEVATLAEMYDGARLLHRGTATAGRVLDALDGSSLAHIAAHGTFRADNPLFSALQLDDGPLTVYDLERLRRAPYRLILPSCESGRLEPVGTDELLGLTAALLPRGTAGIVASPVPVNDAATVPIMLALHAALRRGASLAEGLHQLRLDAPDDAVHRATAMSFVALGAA